MTKTFKKTIQVLLVAVFAVALTFGASLLVKPQSAKAADQAVTFGAAALGDADGGVYGTSIRFDTVGLQWETYHNWVSAEDWSSISDYTTVNGRTVTEINNATTNEQKITLMMQPAGSFSFLRLYIPAEIIPLGEVKSMGILDGWSFNNGTTNYTSSAISFLREGDTMVPVSSYSEVTKKTSADITISDAAIKHRIHEERGADSYVFDIDFGYQIAGEYDVMYDGYKTVRNAIYINGKSIDEWNAQKIAEDSRFNDPSTYTYFPQNSTDPGHLDWFVKPVGIWGTATGFRVSVLQELLADSETITVSIGQGCYLADNFIVSETITKTVFTQNVVDITDDLTFLDNSVHNPASWGETKLYFIHTNNKACWTKSPKGGCLNEYDAAESGGGQHQMKYVYFNGTSLYDINKVDDGAYGSTQENISSGGVYAPILVTMSSELGSSLKLTVPTAFTNGRAAHEEIIVKKGFSVYENGTSYYVSNDVVFTNNGTTNWTKQKKGIEIATEVTGIITKANRTDGGTNENFVIFQISNNDYSTCNTTPITDISSLFGYIDIGGTVVESYSGEKFFNVWNTPNSITFRFADAATLQNITYITVKAGARFPSYNSQYNGAPLTYFVTDEDITFVHDVPNDTWTVGEVPSVMHTVTFMALDKVHHTVEVKEGDDLTNYGGLPSTPETVEDENYVYEFTGNWINRADESVFTAGTKVNSDLIVDAEYTQTEKPAADVDITGELSLHHQGQISPATETYIIKTTANYWTKAPQGGCLNEYDPDGLGGGQVQMKYIYFNGTSIYDINKNDDGHYNAEQSNIASGGVYAPILVMMGSDGGAYSFIQIHVPTGYPDLRYTANENHQSIEIKAGFSVTENDVTYVVTQDIKWLNINGTWVNEANMFNASEVTIDNPRIDGVAKELYKVDIHSTAWNITCNDFDFMYGGQFENYRKYIYINGVSVYDINTTTDDSSYVYSTSPMTGNSDELFAHPVLIETHYQSSDPNTVTLWIHKDYFKSLGSEIVITVGMGYSAFTGDKTLKENVDYDMVANVTVNDGTRTVTQAIIKGGLPDVDTVPSKTMTGNTIYTFDNWYIADTDTVYDITTPITGDISIEARFNETVATIIETEVAGITHHLKTSDENWLAFELTNHDYIAAEDNYHIPTGYEELLRIGFLDKVTLKGTIVLGGSTVSEATLLDVYNAYGALEGPLLKFWGYEQFGIRVPVGSGVEEIVIESGCSFPSYAYVSGATTMDTRYMVVQPATYVYNETSTVFEKRGAVNVDISMELGAAVRLTSDMSTSGLRFQTNIAKASVEELKNLLTINGGEYSSISFGTLIVPTDYLMGGLFTHDWLTKNGVTHLDITSTSTLDNNAWPRESGDYYSFFGSIVNLKTKNYNRAFSGLGYVKLVHKSGAVSYIYARYDSANSRSASFVAKAAISDRSDVETDFYENKVEAAGNWSPYTADEHNFLAKYITWADDEEAISPETLTGLANKGGYDTVELSGDKQILNGPYVELVYSTNVNVWGVFTYTDGSKTANEDFYLQAGTSNHKQYLDIFRYNGVGYGMNTSNLRMTSIKFTNAELEQNVTGKFTILGLYSENKSIDTENQEIYLTVAQDDGSEMTVGAHLGLGGSLTYLAKSGVYEGVIGGNSGWKNGTVAISTDPSVFDANNRYKSGSSSSSYSTEAGYYGHATSSKAADGAVNLINNFDAGRQFQQSWYAQVGGTDSATDGSNGYNRAYCYTGSTDGQYWPYNPVQAGDVVSNPGQIVDYEINESKGYIYVKARAMDWAKGYDPDRPCENAVEGGVTTKSYVENYYRLNSDGTLVVNNRFIDWNGFTDMDTCDWASTELPACYPVHTLNYYVSNIDGDGTWEDALEYNNGLTSWTSNAFHQFSRATMGNTKVEDWFAWANGGDGNAFGMGVYIPNVERYTSGRSNTSTAYYTNNNFENSNALPVPDYKSWFTSQVSAFAQRGNILAYKGMMSNMQPIRYTYQSAYVSNTSYTAPGIDFRMEAYVPIEYSYVICLGTVDNIRSTFKTIHDNGTITNAGNGYEKVGLDSWARADKRWTW